MARHNDTSLGWNMFDDVTHFNEAFGHWDSVLFAFASTQCLCPHTWYPPRTSSWPSSFFWSICFQIATLSLSGCTAMPKTQFTLLPAFLQSHQPHIMCLQWHNGLDVLQLSQIKFLIKHKSTELLRWHGCYFNKAWSQINILRSLVMLLMATR